MSHLIEDETRLYTVGEYRYRLQFYVDSDPSPPWEQAAELDAAAMIEARADMYVEARA